MSLYKDASLVMIPSAYKDGKLYSIRPTDGSGDFTFSRGSNLAATRVDVNGLIEKGRENVLLQSNQFDTTWGKTLSSVIGNQSGYNGSNDAWKMISGASGTYSIVSQSYSGSGVHTLSLYAKAAEWNYVALFINGSGGASKGAIFDLTTGELTNTIFGSPISYSSNSVSDGWWRLSVTLTGTITGANIYLCEVGTSHTSNANDGSSGIYIQDAQLEQGLVATDYIETGTSAAQSGILEDMPRLDYSGGASCPSLLLEPQRSNLFAYSEYYATGQWANTDVNLTTNYALSPEGKMNASLWEFTTTNTLARIQYVLGGITAGATYTQSYYIKSLSGDLTLRIGTSGAVEGEFKDITATSEWQRFDFTSVASGTTEYPRIQNISGTQGAQILVYGAQMELGSYPTSYIPTYGTSQTRSGDQANTLEDSSLFNLAQGTLFFEGNALAEGTDRRISISDGTTNNYISIGYSRFTGNIIAEVFYNGVSQQPNWGATGVTQTDNNKFALSWGSGTMKFYVNGVLKLTDSVTSPVGLDILRFSAGNGSLRMLANTKQVAVFPTALTDSECIALTTL